LRSPPTHG